MRRKVHERNLTAAALRYFCSAGQVLGDRVIDFDLPATCHVSQQERRKYLGNRADLEQRVAIQGPLVALLESAVGNNSPAFAVNDTDNDADALLLRVDSVDEDLTNSGVRR
jgi:hypothetical protein